MRRSPEHGLVSAFGERATEIEEIQFTTPT
jgi:hypothetical protein